MNRSFFALWIICFGIQAIAAEKECVPNPVSIVIDRVESDSWLAKARAIDHSVSDLAECFKLDYFNESKENLVCRWTDGSERYEYDAIFEISNGNLKKETRDIGQLLGEWVTSETKYYKACGKTYMKMEHEFVMTKIEKGRASKECSPNFVKWYKKVLRSSEENQKYKGSLSELTNACGAKFSNEELGWMQNDQALALYKSGNSSACLATIRRIKKEMLSKKLLSAIDFNQKLCEKSYQSKLKTPAKLPDKKPTEDYEESLWSEIARATIPDAQVSLAGPKVDIFDHVFESDNANNQEVDLLKNDQFVLRGLHLTNPDPIYRLWYDWKNKVSALVWVKWNANSIFAASSNIEANQLPESLKKLIKEEVTGSEYTSKFKIFFIDRKGNKTEITLPNPESESGGGKSQSK